MKKRKILLLIPFAGLILSGCSVQDGFSWINSNIFSPVKNWFDGLINPNGKKDDGGGGSGGGGGEGETVHVTSIRWECAKRTLLVGETTTITVTVEPENATDPSLKFESSAPSVLTVSATGEVEAKAVGSATVVITPNDAPSLAKSVTFTVTEKAASLPSQTQAGYMRLAAGEELLKGEKINVAGAIGEKYYVMQQYTSGNNIKALEISLDNGELVIAEDLQFTVITNGDGTISLRQSNGKYLSACGDAENKNYLKVVDEIDSTAKFSYTVDEDGYAQLQAEAVQHGYLCLNPNTQYGDPLFGCYKSASGYTQSRYAIYHDGNGSSEHTPVESVEFEKEQYDVEAGKTVKVVANVLPDLADDKELIYEVESAEPEGCVTLEGNVVTAVTPGSAVIVAKSHENEEILDRTTIVVSEHIERNYGTLENPLTVSEARAVIDLDDGKPAETIYVTGKVSKNDAYNSQYGNTNVWITDGVNEFELYGALMPEGFEPAQPEKNALVDKKVVAHGTGKIYKGTYEFDKNCQIDSITDEEVPLGTVTGLIEGSATGIPETIEQGESLDRTDINVGVYLSDGSEGVTHPDSIVLSTEELGVVGGKLVVGEFEYEFTIEVIAKVERNYGTLENPLTVSEAEALIAEVCPNSGDYTSEQIYCEGTVSEKGTVQNYGYKNVKVSDGEKELLIYSINMTDDQKAAHDVGKTIKFHGYATNYNGTLEFTSKTVGEEKVYVVADDIITPVVPVNGISLDKDSLDMEVGMPDKTLVATVLPENATNKAVEWESANPEVATVNDGVVHAVAVGETTVTATSVADPTKSASCTVTVSEQTKELVSVQIKTMPKVEYTEGEKLDLSDLVLTLYYDDQSTEDVTTGYTTNIALDHELTTEDTELIITYGEFGIQPITLTVTAKPQPTHAGTAEDPYTGEDAVIVANNLAAGGVTDGSYYVKGVVVSFEENFNPSYGNYSFKIEGGFIGWRLLNGESKAKFSTGDLAIGDTVTMYVQIQSYIKNAEDTPKPESKNGYIVSIEKPFIAPETVTITSGSELGVGSDMNLAATVGPEGAAQDVEWTIVTGGDYATLSDGVLTGVAPGDVTVKATAVGYENVYAEKTITVSSSVVPTEQEVYTLTPASGSNNSYAGNCDIAINGVTWNLTGNSTMQPWRLGGKSLSGVDRTLYSKTAIADDISKIEVQHGGASSITVNSWTLVVSKNDDFSDPISTLDLTFAASSTTTITRPENADWSNCYFKFVYNLTVSGSSNKFIEFTGASFYAVK